MPLPMPHYNSFAAHAPAVPSCQAGSHLAGPCSNRKLISSTFIAYHFDKDLIRIYIIIPPQSRAHEQQIFNCRRHTFERTTPVYFRNWNGKLKFASLCNEMYNLLRQMQT